MCKLTLTHPLSLGDPMLHKLSFVVLKIVHTKGTDKIAVKSPFPVIGVETGDMHDHWTQVALCIDARAERDTLIALDGGNSSNNISRISRRSSQSH
jgi:hypothetical protein